MGDFYNVPLPCMVNDICFHCHVLQLGSRSVIFIACVKGPESVAQSAQTVVTFMQPFLDT